MRKGDKTILFTSFECSFTDAIEGRIFTLSTTAFCLVLLLLQVGLEAMGSEMVAEERKRSTVIAWSLCDLNSIDHIES